MSLKDHYDEIRQLRDSGWSLLKIGNKFQVSDVSIYYVLNPNKRIYDSNKSKIRSKRFRDKLRKATINALGGKCKNCGFSDIRALQIDHVNGRGKKDVQELGGTHNLYRKILSMNSIERDKKYQLLCANCNWIKKYENNETPNKWNQEP